MTRLGLLRVKTSVWLQPLVFLAHILQRSPNDRLNPLDTGPGKSFDLYEVSSAITLPLAQHSSPGCLVSRVRTAGIDCHQ